jgi:hypothetical protein
VLREEEKQVQVLPTTDLNGVSGVSVGMDAPWGVAYLLNVEGEAMLCFHAGGGEDGTDGAGGSALLSDYLAEVGRGDPEPKQCAGGLIDCFNGDLFVLIHQGFGKAGDEVDHGLSEFFLAGFICKAQLRTSREKIAS